MLKKLYCQSKNFIDLCTKYKLVIYTIVEIQNSVILKLHKAGIKPSIQRVAVMEYLIANPVHPTAEQIFNKLYQQMPTLSKTTIYNTLRLFVENGLVQMLSIDERNVRYDADVSEHAHFKCTKCGRLMDVPIKHFNAEIVNCTGFVVTSYQLYYSGICKKCLDNDAK